MSGSLRARACAAAIVFACCAHGASSCRAGDIAFAGEGPFEACLASEAKAWLDARAEDVVNGAASVKTLDDAHVAGWTVATMKMCGARGTPADAGNETAFGKYMARWREHLYELARVIRSKGGSD